MADMNGVIDIMTNNDKTLGEVIAGEFKYIYEQGCKDTAEKILNYLWKQRNAIGQLMILEEDLINFAKQFNIEVKG